MSRAGAAREPCDRPCGGFCVLSFEPPLEPFSSESLLGNHGGYPPPSVEDPFGSTTISFLACPNLGCASRQHEHGRPTRIPVCWNCQARQRCPMCAAPFELSDVWSATAFVRTGYETGSRVTRTIASPRGSESDSGDSACRPCVVTASVVITKCGSHATDDDSRLLTTTSCFFSDVPPG